MNIPGAWRIKKGIKKISRKFKTADIVLMYHRVASPLFDPWRLSVSPENFSSQMVWLKENCYVTTLEDLIEKSGTYKLINKPRVVITFDDGYCDNFEVAYPILNKYKLPATIFISTGYIGRKGLYWWDDLVRVILETKEVPEELVLEDVLGKKYQFHLGDDSKHNLEGDTYQSWMPWEKAPSSRHQLYYDLWKLFRESNAQNFANFQKQLYRWAGVSAEGNNADWPMTVEQLKYIAGDELIQIGGHTINHYSFKNIDLEMQKHELVEAKEQLERWINQKVSTFSYPFGDYTTQSESLAKKAGYKIACTTSPHCFDATYSPYHVPRFEVHNWNGNALGDKINNWINNRK
ncbi:hypothetical protein BH23BAC1_BH23BAC1_47970 [soil metagenome]